MVTQAVTSRHFRVEQFPQSQCAWCNLHFQPIWRGFGDGGACVVLRDGFTETIRQNSPKLKGCVMSERRASRGALPEAPPHASSPIAAAPLSRHVPLGRRCSPLTGVATLAGAVNGRPEDYNSQQLPRRRMSSSAAPRRESRCTLGTVVRYQ